jgi:hypothetical protein
MRDDTSLIVGHIPAHTTGVTLVIHVARARAIPVIHNVKVAVHAMVEGHAPAAFVVPAMRQASIQVHVIH